MEPCSRRNHGHTAVAAIGSLVVLAGLVSAVPQPAFGDDDDWHTEAARPIGPALQPDADFDDAKPLIASRPSQETVYAPPALLRSLQPLPLILTAYQTGDTARRQ